jgi:hypothetical protein
MFIPFGWLLPSGLAVAPMLNTATTWPFSATTLS